MPFNLKKLSERRVELMTQLENLVKTCETETRAFNEEEQKQYNDILTEVRSIDATLDAADQGAAGNRQIFRFYRQGDMPVCQAQQLAVGIDVHWRNVF